jgi:hypothetical protein
LSNHRADSSSLHYIKIALHKTIKVFTWTPSKTRMKVHLLSLIKT